MSIPLNPRRDPFIRSFKSLVREECARDPALRRKMRRPLLHVLRQAMDLLFGVAGIAVAIALPVIAILAVSQTHNGITLPFGAILASSCCIFYIFNRHPTFYADSGCPVLFMFMPVDENYYDAFKRRELIVPPWIYLVFSFVFLCATAYASNVLHLRSAIVIFGISALCASAAWAFTLWLAHRYIPPFITNCANIAVAIAVLALPMLFYHGKGPPEWLPGFVQNYGGKFAILTPGGWAFGIVAESVGVFPRGWSYAWVPLVALSASLLFAFRSLERRFPHTEFLELDLFWGPGGEAANESANDSRAAVDIGMDEFRRQWAQDIRTSRIGWLERVFIRRLSAEEKTMLEHVTPRFPGWTPLVSRILGIGAAITAILVLVLQNSFYDFGALSAAPIVAGVITLVFLVWATSPACLLFKRMPPFGTVHPYSYPAYFAIRQKAAIFRCLVILPFYLAVACVVTYFSETAAPAAVIMKILLVTTFAFPCWHHNSSGEKQAPTPGPGFKMLTRGCLFAIRIIS